MDTHVGEVVSVDGISVVIRCFENASKATVLHNGEKYKGVAVRGGLIIRRESKDIVCSIESECLEESKFEADSGETIRTRKVKVRPVGYIQEGIFYQGIKHLPMIKDPAYLMSEAKISLVYGSGEDKGFVIGKSVAEGLPVFVPWKSFFNTHIGIVGNSGSGKSNTLAKLYTTLFDNKKDYFSDTSKFLIIDFNGEYSNEQLTDGDNKKVIRLNTRNDNGDKFLLNKIEFWNKETLAILFKATTNVQAPFINRLINGREIYGDGKASLKIYIKDTFRRAFVSASQKRESIELLKSIAHALGAPDLIRILNKVVWLTNKNKFYYPGIYFDGREDEYNKVFYADVDALNVQNLDAFEEFKLRVHLQLINDLVRGFVHFDYIQPLLKRIDSSLASFRRIFSVVDTSIEDPALTVVSLRECSQEVKKVVSSLLAKRYYEQHKLVVKNPPDKTFHLIIDEAHNILSEQSTRESEGWKDYRLELFEEIIKEGRKFGFFLTLASQRPADISPTIMSQIHNFFIHRLINDEDLRLIDNTIATLDALSKSMIPVLGKGCCIVTGTSFDLPLVVQMDLLDSNLRPDSADVDLGALWS